MKNLDVLAIANARREAWPRSSRSAEPIAGLYPRGVRVPGGVLALLALAAALIGCGSYTKRDFIARADAICASTLRQTRLIAPPSFTQDKAQRLRALAGYAQQVLPLIRSETTQLRGLRRPSQATADRDALTRYLAAAEGVAVDYRDLSTAAAKNDAVGVARAEAALSTSQVGSLAARYGLRTCGTAGATTAS